MGSWAKSLTGIALLVALSGCASDRHPYRAEYDVEKFGDLIVSNSSTPNQAPEKTAPGTIRFSYDLLIQNTSTSAPATLHTTDAHFNVGAQALDIAVCEEFRTHQRQLSIPPGGKARVACEITLKADPQNRLAYRDTAGELQLPFYMGRDSEQHTSEATKMMSFKYLLKIEDFE